MRSDEITPFIDRINVELADIFKKLYPGIKNPLLTNYPHMHGINAHTGLTLEFLKNADQTEIKRLYEATKAAKHFFTIHLNDRIFATCFVLQYRRDRRDAMPVNKWFLENVHPYSITFKKSVIGLPFDFIMAGLHILGATDTTCYKISAYRKGNGNFKISPPLNPYQSEEIIVGTDDNLKVLADYMEQHREDHRIVEALEKIENEFMVFCQRTLDRYQTLLTNLDSLEGILQYESKIPRKVRIASFIQLPFSGTKKNEIIECFYQNLNGLYFETSMENFKKIFTPDNSFERIHWHGKANTLVHLFTGFDFSIDGFKVEFPDIMNNNSNKWYTLADKFHIQRKSEKTLLPKYLEIIKRNGQPPRELKKLIHFIDQVKKIWFK